MQIEIQVKCSQLVSGRIPIERVNFPRALFVSFNPAVAASDDLRQLRRPSLHQNLPSRLYFHCLQPEVNHGASERI